MGQPVTETPAIVRELIDQGGFGRIQVLVVCLALMLNMLDGFDITAMSFTVHSMGQDLGISVDRLGIVFSVALAGMMLGAMFIAPLSDRVGRRKMILICVLVIGLSMVLTGWASSLWELILWRGLTGLGVGGMLASLATICAEYTPEKYRSLAVMGMTSGYPLGAMTGGYLVAPLIADQGWQFVFFYGGAATLVMALVIFLWMPESLQFLLLKRTAELAPINAILRRLNKPVLNDLPEMQTAYEADRNTVVSLLTPERRNRTLILWSSFFFCFISLYFMLSWIPKLVVLSGLSEEVGVYASVVFNGGAIIGIISLGWMASRLGLTNLIAFFLCGAAALMLVFAFWEGANHLFVYLLIIGFLLQGGFTGLYATAAKLYPTEIRSTGVGWAIGLGRFGAVVGPYAGGLLIAGGVGMEINFVVFALPLLIGGLIAWVLSVR